MPQVEKNSTITTKNLQTVSTYKYKNIPNINHLLIMVDCSVCIWEGGEEVIAFFIIYQKDPHSWRNVRQVE